MRQTLRLIAISVVVCCAVVASALPPQQWAVDSFAAKPYMQHASLGVAVRDIATGETIAQHMGEQSQITASTMKTVISLASLELLGPHYRFATPVYAVGQIDGSRLHGDIVVVGSGDPTLGSRYISSENMVSEVVTALQQMGINRVDGEIVIDNSLFGNTPAYQIDWCVGDLAWSYGAGVHALNYRDNIVALSLDTDKDNVRHLTTTPVVPGLALIDQTEVSAGGSNLDCTAQYGTPAIVVYGQADAGHHGFNAVNPVPDHLLRAELLAALDSADIKVKHKVKNFANDTTLLVTHYSPELPAIITSLLDRSDNMFAHALLRAVAARDSAWLASDGKSRDLDDIGVNVVKRQLEQMEIDTAPLFMLDGSGLARANKSSANFFTRMLTVAAARDYDGVRLSDLMPQAGRRVAEPLNSSPLSTQIVLKSGSMNSVQCFVGYYPAENPRYCWAVLVGNYTCPRATLKQGIGELLVNLFTE